MSALINHKSYALKVSFSEQNDYLLIQLMHGAKSKKEKLFQFVSSSIPEVKQVIELYHHHTDWHRKISASSEGVE